MATFKCPVCESDVDENASKCPVCGLEFKQEEKKDITGLAELEELEQLVEGEAPKEDVTPAESDEAVAEMESLISDEKAQIENIDAVESIVDEELGEEKYAGDEAVCPVCYGTVSAFAERCEHCGAEFAPESRCGFCGEIVESDAIFCPACGHSLIEDESICPKCGEIVGISETKCPRCGTEFATDSFRCTNCGTAVTLKDIVCPNCGTMLKEGVKLKAEIMAQPQITLPAGATPVAVAAAPVAVSATPVPTETVIKIESVKIGSPLEREEPMDVISAGTPAATAAVSQAAQSAPAQAAQPVDRALLAAFKQEMKIQRELYPFTAIVGQEDMKLALILNAIDPEIGGVLIQGQKGTGKSISVRGLAELLPEIEVISGCLYSCDPKDKEKWCWECKEKYGKGDVEIPVSKRPIKVVELPLNATEDRVVGTIDIEKILTQGLKAFEPGILAEANRGILYIDEINLLDDYIVDVLLDAAAMGVVTVEREAVSVSYPGKFIIVGSMNPEEGALRPQLLDRIALQVKVKGVEDIFGRMEIVKRREEFNANPAAFREKYKSQQEELRKKIERAREILKDVSITIEQLELIAKISLSFGVDGHRADIIIERTAKALAAWNGRLKVELEDILKAAEFALPHRMRKRPFEEEEFSVEKLRRVVEELR
ncbi:MAG: zinc ribbon domain-containing protein [Thermoplasmata archaeon]